MVVAQELERLGLFIGVDGCATRRGGPVLAAEAGMACGDVVVCCGRGIGGVRRFCSVACGDVLVVCCSRGIGGVRQFVTVCSSGGLMKMSSSVLVVADENDDESVVLGAGCSRGRDDEDVFIGTGCGR